MNHPLRPAETREPRLEGSAPAAAIFFSFPTNETGARKGCKNFVSRGPGSEAEVISDWPVRLDKIVQNFSRPNFSHFKKMMRADDIDRETQPGKDF